MFGLRADNSSALRVARAVTRLTVHRTSYILELLQPAGKIWGQRQSVLFATKSWDLSKINFRNSGIQIFPGIVHMLSCFTNCLVGNQVDGSPHVVSGAKHSSLFLHARWPSGHESSTCQKFVFSRTHKLRELRFHYGS